MKKYVFSLGLLMGSTFYASAQTGIGTTAPHSSAILEISSETKGLLLPRLSSAAITQLGSTATEGLIVYDKEKKIFVGWDGSKWQNLSFEATTLSTNSAPIASTVQLSGNAVVGNTLTGSYTYADADGDVENTTSTGTSFQWQLANDSAGTNTVNATGTGNSGTTGGTAKTYILQSGEAGKYIRYCVQPIATIGTTTGILTCSGWSTLITSSTSISLEDFNSTNYIAVANGGFGFTSVGTTNLVNGNGNTPNAPKYVTGNGYQVNNSTATLTSDLLSIPTFANSLELSLRVASFSTNGTNGADAGDTVTIALDTGAGFSNEITVTGNGNTTWSFSDTNVLSVVYDGNNTALTSAGPKGTLKITGIPTTLKRVKIIITNDNTAEQWVIDDVTLKAL